MVPAVLLSSVLLAASPAEAPAEPPHLSGYEAARATAGRDPGANVKLALWCEAHGLRAERLKHLALAVLTDPTNATARGLLGLVAYRGQWKRPEAVAQKVKADEALTARLAEYNARRAKAPETSDGQWALAAWCEQNGLDAEARAHFTAVTRLDPSREAAWKRLGCKKVGGRWVTEADLAAEKAEAEAQKKADRHWKPLLTKWRGMLDSNARRDAAEAALAGVSDPRAVPSVWAVFVAGKSANHELAVQLLGQIDAAASSRGLAYLAVFDTSAEVRRAATETLKRRDPREFAGLLVALLRDPLKYEVRPVGGPGSPGAIFVAGERFNVQRIYAPPSMPGVRFPVGYKVIPDGDGLPMLVVDSSPRTVTVSSEGGMFRLQNFETFNPTDPALAQAVAAFRAQGGGTTAKFFREYHVQRELVRSGKLSPSFVLDHAFVTATRSSQALMMQETQIPIGRVIADYQRTALAAQEQLNGDLAAIDAYNGELVQGNGRVAQVLSSVSGKSPGEDRKVWTKWWFDIQGYAYTPPQEAPQPTIVENVPLNSMPSPHPSVTYNVQLTPAVQGSWRLGMGSTLPISCFGGGTLVRTLDGSRPIESLRAGDRVLTQDIKTGALGYNPVTFVHHNPPSPTFLVKVGGDTIVSSPFHRFWVAGKGWVMARDLKGDEVLRLLDGPTRIDSIGDGPVQPVYNLDVAGDHDFFAGSAAALVHDNTLPDTRLAPFDAAPAFASAATSR